MKALTRRLDPRGVTIYDIQPPRTYETHMPWLWRFWRKIPGYGDLAIFYHSWYSRVLGERVEASLPKKDWPKAFRDIRNFERTLSDDGYVIVKFFFHITKEQQAERFHQLEEDSLSNWRVRPHHWARHAKYDQYAAAAEEMLKRTHSKHAPWHVIAAADRRWARVSMFETTVSQIEMALQARGVSVSVQA
jgi:polyphosphate kinase 2 (PPK2 family)